MSAPTPTPNRSPTAAAFARQFITTLVLITVASVLLTLLYVQAPSSTPPSAHSAIVLVWSGMRPDMVTASDAPNLTALGSRGAVALDHHGIFPSTTLATAATLATGTNPGATSAVAGADGSGTATTITPAAALGSGIALDTPLLQTAASATPTATPTASAAPSPTATSKASPKAAPTATPSPSATHVPEPAAPAQLVDLSSDAALLAADNALGGSLLTAPTLATEALHNGLSVSYEGASGTALLPMLAPVEQSAAGAYLIDEHSTFPASLAGQLAAQGVSLPEMSAEDAVTLDQQFAKAYVSVLLPALVSANKLYLSVIDFNAIAAAGTQNGIGSPAQLAAIQADDAALGEIVAALTQDNQINQANVIVTSDHGLSDVIEPGNTSAAEQQFTMPNTALRTDIAALMMAAAAHGELPGIAPKNISRGAITQTTSVVVVPNGGDDAIYLPSTPALLAVGNGDASFARTVLVDRLVVWLQSLDQVGVIFVADGLSPPAGTLRLSDASLASSRAPAIVFSFASQALDVGQHALNALGFGGSAFADTTALAAGGTLSRRDLHTLLYAQGPNFRSQMLDPAPTGAIDLVPTLDHILGLSVPQGLPGRILSEMLTDGSGSLPVYTPGDVASTEATLPDGSVLVEALAVEDVGPTTYIEGGAVARSSQPVDRSTLISQALALASQE
jgi:hypothetical protein